MLTPDQIEALRIKSGQIIGPVIEFLISDIASRISEAGQLTSTAAYQIWRAQNLGISQKKLKTELQKRLKVSKSQLQALLKQAAEVGYDFDISRFPTVEAIPFDENESLQRIVQTAAKMADENFTNLTQTMGFVTYDGKVTGLTEAYRKSCDFAFEKVFTGAQDYNSAVRQAVKGLAEKGIQTIDYESGVHRSLEAAVRGNFMGGINIMSREINQHNHDMLGCDGWEISAHEFSAPDHEPFQGRQYSDAEFQRLQAMLVRDFESFSCGHDVMGIILGINEPQYTPEKLEAMRRRNEEGFVIDGKHYTGYEATQRQRGLERTLRKQKRKILIDEKTGDKEKLAIDQTRYVVANDEYHRFSKAAGLRLQHERANVPGFGAKQHSAAEKTEREKKITKKTEKPIEKLNVNGIMNSTEMFSKDVDARSGFKFISDERFAALTVEARKKGAIILRGTPEVERHLSMHGASASTMGDVLMFKKDVCLFEVLEETHHFNQNLAKLNDDKGEPLRTILNEIDAKKYLLSVSQKYQIPRNELEHIQEQLSKLEMQLDEHMKGGS